MAKKNKDREIAIVDPELKESDLSPVEEPKGPKLPKKIAKSAEALVRQLDNALSELYTLSYDASQLVADVHDSVTTEVPQKDVDRLHEIHDILQGVTRLMYPMVSRMSRKYVGKEIEPVEGNSRKRKALKDK